MKITDLAFRKGDEGHPGKPQAFVDTGDVLLVAGKTVERLGKNHRKLAGKGILHELPINSSSLALNCLASEIRYAKFASWPWSAQKPGFGRCACRCAITRRMRSSVASASRRHAEPSL